METINEQLVAAVTSNKLEEARRLLVERADPNYIPLISNASQDTPLVKAICNGKPEMVHLLLQYGANVNITGEKSAEQTPLTHACFHPNRRSDILQLLLRYGADVNHVNQSGQSDFVHVMRSGLLPFDVLINVIDFVKDIPNLKDPVTGESLLHLVSQREGDGEQVVQILEKLIRLGIHVNHLDDDGNTPLHSMAFVTGYHSLQYFLDSGADIHAKNRKGETVLHAVANNTEGEEFEECLRLLVEKGCDINAVDNEGRTALHHVSNSTSSRSKDVEEFLKYDIKKNVSDNMGDNEIHLAVERLQDKIDFDNNDVDNCVGVITSLVHSGVNLNEGNIFGVTPLHLATNLKTPIILETLLSLGADARKQTKTGATPLHWSTMRFITAPVLIHWYAKHGYDLNAQDNFGSTALHWAIWFREQIAVKCLLQNGANATIRDNLGHTSSDFAKFIKYGDFSQILEMHEKLDQVTDVEEIRFDYHGTDIFEECPTLMYVYKENDEVDISEWEEHLECHKESIKTFINTVMESENMGLYYNLDENSIISSMIENIMFNLAKGVVDRNSLFECHVKLAGSLYDGTKIKLPDEYDYIWNLSEFNKAFVPVESKSFPGGFVKLQLKDQTSRMRFAEYIDSSGYLDGTKVNRTLYSMVNEEMVKLYHGTRRDELQALIFDHGLDDINGQLSCMKFFYAGQQAKLVEISVDVVPTLCIPNWKPANFLRKDVLLPRIESEISIPIILKNPEAFFVKDSNLFFRTSFANLEQSIIRSIPLHIKKGYIILKALVASPFFPDIVDIDGSIDEYITSYKLKTCFLHQLEKAFGEDNGSAILSSDKANASQASLEWSRRIIAYCEQCISETSLPSFFDSQKNLLQLEGSTQVFNTKFYLVSVSCLETLVDISSSDELSKELL